MDPKEWGRAGWIFLFSIVLAFPLKPDFEQTDNYVKFFNYLQYVLPCEICRLHYANNLNHVPIEPYLTSRDNAFMWVLKIHNLVNKQLGKPILTRDDVMKKYFGVPSSRGYAVDCRVDPTVWGLSGWKFFFCIAYGYPQKPSFQDHLNYKNFFSSVRFILPCETYRTQFINQWDQLPIDPYLTTPSYLFMWVLKMLNMTNKQIGRPLMGYSDVVKVYFGDRLSAKKPKPNQTAKGIGLIEGFNGNVEIEKEVPYDITLTKKPENLLNKNLSLALLVALAGYTISQS